MFDVEEWLLGHWVQQFTPLEVVNSLNCFFQTFFLLIYIDFFPGLDDQNCYKTVERYDIELNQWSQVQDMNNPRGGVAVATFGIK